MNEKARARLVKAGWREGRRVSTDQVEAIMDERGFTLFPAARAFIECYGGLSVHSTPRPLESDTLYFHTHPDDVGTDPSWIPDWEEASGTRMFPIGATAFGDYALIIDEHGRIFGMDQYLELSYWADDADALFDIILGHGDTFRPVYPEDRWPMRVRRFGNMDRFAIDVDVEPDEHRLGVAHLALWAGGWRLGATEAVEVLATFLSSLERSIAGMPLGPEEFTTQPADQVFATVHALLTDPDPTRADFPWDRSDLFQRLLLLPNGCAPFDGEWAILLREPERDRLLIRPFGNTTVREVIVEPGEVVATARAVIDHSWRD